MAFSPSYPTGISGRATRNIHFVGKNGAGAITPTGVTPAVGERVTSIGGIKIADGTAINFAPVTDYEAVISVAGQIQQVSVSDLSGYNLTVCLQSG
jgi:hypothetical protein